MRKLGIFSFVLFSLLLSVPFCAEAQKIGKVVIDAGHGGTDPGANSSGYKEKDITLRVATEVGSMIKSRFPEVQIIYTRSSDKNVALVDRSRKANDAGADLFISIHVNSAVSTSAKGYETFVLGPSKTKQNLDVAMRENSVISYEDNYMKVYDGFDPKSAESYILFSLLQDSYLDRSMRLAQLIQGEYSKRLTNTTNRGVKQAGFLVLWRTATPSVLTEIGFISNADDRRFMTSDQGCKKIAQSIAEAFAKYKEEMDAQYGGGYKPSTVETQPQPQTQDNEDDYRPAKPAKQTQTQTQTQTEKPKAESHGPATAESDNTDNGPRTIYRSVRYKIQIKSASSPIKRSSRELGCYAYSAEERLIGGRYKYFVGNVKSYKEALSLQTEVRDKGFSDAFIAAFSNGAPISIADAKISAP